MANLAKYIMIGFSWGICALTQNLWASEPLKQDAVGYTPPSFDALKLSEAEIRWYNYGDLPVISEVSGEKLKKQRKKTEEELKKNYGHLIANICLQSPKSWFEKEKIKSPRYYASKQPTFELSSLVNLSPFLPVIRFPDGLPIEVSEEEVKKKFPSRTSLLHAIGTCYHYKEQLDAGSKHAFTARVSAVYLAQKVDLLLKAIHNLQKVETTLEEEMTQKAQRYYNLALSLIPRIFDFSYRAASLGDSISLDFFYWLFEFNNCNVPEQIYRASLYNTGIGDTWEYFREHLPTRAEYSAQLERERAALPAPTAPLAPAPKAVDEPSTSKAERRNSGASHSSQSYRDHSSDEEGTGMRNENMQSNREPEEVKTPEDQTAAIDPFASASSRLATLLRRRAANK